MCVRPELPFLPPLPPAICVTAASGSSVLSAVPVCEMELVHFCPLSYPGRPRPTRGRASRRGTPDYKPGTKPPTLRAPRGVGGGQRAARDLPARAASPPTSGRGLAGRPRGDWSEGGAGGTHPRGEIPGAGPRGPERAAIGRGRPGAWPRAAASGWGWRRRESRLLSVHLRADARSSKLRLQQSRSP